MPKPPFSVGENPLNAYVDTPGMRLEALSTILSVLLQPAPNEWLISSRNGTRNGRASTGALLDCADCHSYRELVGAWRKALRWTEGLDTALSVMLAAVTSTKAVGDQLWVKVIGPPACGKSTLCEAISVASRYVLAKSTLRGFHSGYTANGSEEDNSLIAQVKDKTLITKDGDTLLKQPNLGQILAEARDLYDSTSRTYYRNAASRDYSGIRMTWILCGTNSLRAIDSSELGERFLDCVVMEGIDDELEDEVLWRVANRADRNLSLESDGLAVTQYEPELATAMALTGGYVEHLRRNATELLSRVHASDEAKRYCAILGKFVAYMRARPSKVSDENEGREFAARLVSQMVRLAKCLAVALGRKTVDEEVMRRVKSVALDTSRGDTLKIVESLYDRPTGSEVKALALNTGRTEEKLRGLIRFLNAVGVIQPAVVVETNGRSNGRRWTLTSRLRKLYEAVNA